jgi:hypothetical protein
VSDPASKRLIESREIAKQQITAAVELAGEFGNQTLAEVTSRAAIASAVIYLADVILFGFTPRDEA